MSFRSFGAVAAFMTLVWLLVSVAAIYKIVEERRGAFEAIVESHQEAIVSGQYRPFVEGLSRTIGGAYTHPRICWSNDHGPCESLESSVRNNSWTLALPIRVVLSSGPQQIATVQADVSLLSAIEFSLLVLLSFFLTGAAAIWAMKSFASREKILRQHLADAVLAAVHDQAAQDVDHLPAEIRPIAYALLQSVSRLQALQISTATKDAMNQLAAQVAHDIRSPLAALAMVERDFLDLPEETRLIVRSAVSRIRDISNQLIEKNRSAFTTPPLALTNPIALEPARPQLLSSIIEDIISEKRMQFRSRIDVNIDSHLGFGAYGLFANVQLSEFKRVLSNLINNSVESVTQKGVVAIWIDPLEQNQIEIRVCDNGCGIPPEILGKLGQRGESHGKHGGSGLGLHHARKMTESWGGKLNLKSKVGQGTEVSITLPRSSAPEWFVDELKIAPNSKIIILDDDESIHRIWERRAESARLREDGVELVHFSTPKQIRKWIIQLGNQVPPTIYLIDFELLGFTETGLDLIEGLGIASQSILVTSRYEETRIRDRCRKLSIRLIPKGMAGFVPISIFKGATEIKPSTDLAAILIDDDAIVHLSWKYAAKIAHRRFAGFTSAESFFEEASEFDSATPVYIDSHLGKDSTGQDVLGEQVAKKIFDLGFKKIYLATGLAPANAAQLPWLAGITGKDAPFKTLTS